MPSLWKDVFQKVKALGYTGVSFYVDWALLEGTPGTFRADGTFDLGPFFDAASETGIYLIARPGPYINAEVSGGGFPGYLQRIFGVLRTNDSSFLDATNLYMSEIGRIIADAQITNGGPVVLVQPENEYTNSIDNVIFPNGEYFAYVEKQLHDAGIVVPLISNDASPEGFFAPGNGTGSVDIYGHDGYPLGFDCSNPYWWKDGSLPTTWRALHEQESPTTPYSILEFQGGSFDPWGGPGFAKCLSLVSEQFERVFYKNDFSFLVTIFNQYMIFGGTNWGNLGHPSGYTSYDYGAAIAEDLTVSREKYSEAKLLVNSLRASPAYLTATPANVSNTSYSDTQDIAVTPLYGYGTNTNFYVVRHAAYNSNDTTQYKLLAQTSVGNLTIPQTSHLSSTLTLNGRDSKIHVTDFDVGGTSLLYSTGEIFTWTKDAEGTTLVLFGGENEVHELAIALPNGTSCQIGSVSGPDSIGANAFYNEMRGSYNVFQWRVIPEGVKVNCSGSSGTIKLYLLWRNEVYNWWPLELESSEPVSNYTSPSKQTVLVRGGHLLRTAAVVGQDLYLTGDVNTTTTLQVIAGAPGVQNVFFNGQQKFVNPEYGTFEVTFQEPTIKLPDLSALSWQSIDSLPELSPSYSDASWRPCDHPTSKNPLVLSTPTSLYASDYGYHAGSLLYRGHFTSTDSISPTSLTLLTQGGYAYAYSVFLNGQHIYSFPGVSTSENQTTTIPLPILTPDTPSTITIALDHMGLDENFVVGVDQMKRPRGILSYNLTSYPQDAISWKITGNLGGEQYQDLLRGPLNEGGFFAERQGYHLPGAPTNSSASWSDATPFEPITGVAVKFFTTTFSLALPTPQYAIPLGVQFTNQTATSDAARPINFRAVLYVNGYQYGKYVNNIGPQTLYPVPEGILDYRGTNTLGLLVWCMEEGGCEIQMGGIQLVTTGQAVLTGRGEVAMAAMGSWVVREGAY